MLFEKMRVMIHFKLTIHEEYVCEYVCLWVRLCVCVRTHMCVYVCVYMNMCVYACACISLCLHKGYGSLCKDYSYDCSLVEELLRLSLIKSGLRGSWISNSFHLD